MQIRQNTYRWSKALCWIGLLVGLYACASRGSGPQGGPKDETPPQVKVCTPPNSSVRVGNFKQIVIELDENVSLVDPQTNVVVSPTQKETPTIKSSGRKVYVSFYDSLNANTTYSVDFGDAIVDYNEKNPLKDYVYRFSTGDHIDSLEIKGYVLNAQTLLPMEGVTVGIYEGEVEDSLFRKKPMVRTAHTRSDGSFTLRCLAEGNYMVYALNDHSKSNYYAHTGTEIAFTDNVVTALPPMQEVEGRPARNVLMLRAFKEESNLHYFKRGTRPVMQELVLVFGKAPEQEPVLELLEPAGMLAVDSLGQRQAWYKKEKYTRADSLCYWLTDSVLLQKDTIRLRMLYLKTDSTGQLQAQTDTLSLYMRQKSTEKHKNKTKETRMQALHIQHNFKSTMEVYDTIYVQLSEPLRSWNPEKIHLELKKDSLFSPISFEIMPDDSLCTKKLSFFYQKSYGSTYKFTLDSAALYSDYGKVNTTFYKTYSLNVLENYANLYVVFPQVPENGVVELLNGKEEVVTSGTIEEGEADFQDLKPGKYYMRMYMDENGNGRWDTGNLLEHRQPEPMYYYPGELNLRANWDNEETWDYQVTDFLHQRPEALATKKDSKK